MSTPETTDNCVSPLQPGVALERLQRLSQRGKLAGFKKTGAHACEVAVFGTVYDWAMAIEIADHEGGSSLTMTTRLKRTMPTVVVAVLVFARYPGVLLTHSMLTTYFGWYPTADWVTVAWYVPLTLLAIPVMLKQYKASKAAAAESRAELVEKIKKAVDAAG